MRIIKRLNNKYKFFSIIIFIIMLSISSYFIINKLCVKEELININELSEEFMEDYFEGMNKFKENDNEENILIVTSMKELKNTYGATDIVSGPNHQYFLQYENKEDLEKAFISFESDEDIYFVDENITYYIEENDYQIESTIYNSWGVEKTGLDDALTIANSKNLNEVVVAIIDSGLDVTLFNKYYNGKIKETYNILNYSTTDMSDENGHGTHIAGTIAESTPDNVKIMPIKASDSTGSFTTTDIISAINYIVSYDKADVINMSFGSYYYQKSFYVALASAEENNIICVAAAGNDSTNTNHYPSGYDNTISISSITESLELSSFSNYGDTITFAAPGSSIKSIMGKDTYISQQYGNIDGDDDHETISGTSMATPHAVSAVAILKSYNEDLTLDNVIELIKEKAYRASYDTEWDEYTGYGIINFNDVEFCDGICCDEFNVYKSDTCELSEVSSLELNEVIFTNYNYGSINNILDTKINIKYEDLSTRTKKLWELDNLTIENYDPYNTSEQTIKITYKDHELTFKLTNPSSYPIGWEYEVLSEEDKTIELTEYLDNYELESCDDEDVCINKLYIPENINDYTVVSFKDMTSSFNIFDYSGDGLAFEYIYLPSTFKRIGNYALSNLPIDYIYGDSNGIELGSSSIPSNIKEISVPISKLSSSILKDSVIEYIIFDKNITEIPSNAFENSTIKDIYIKDSDTFNNLTSIGDSAFEDCKNLTNFDFSTVLQIGDYAFMNTSNLKIDVEGQYTSIGAYAFYNSAITSFDAENVTEIKTLSFFNCDNLETIDLKNVETIASQAFSYSGITNINIPSTLNSIQSNSFSYTSLVNIEVDNNNTVYKSIDGALINKETNELILGSYTTLVDGKLPDGITSLGMYAFSGNSLIKKVIIPSDITFSLTNGYKAFKNCINLEKVIIYSKENKKTSLKNAFSIDDYLKEDSVSREYYAYKSSNTKSNLKEITSDSYSTYWVVHDIDPSSIVYSNKKDTYYVGDNVIIPTATFTYNEDNSRSEVATSISVKIGNEDRNVFKYGDTSYTVTYKNGIDYTVTKEFSVEVNKKTPTYTLPSNLTGYLYDKLSDIELPTGFSWMDEDTILTTLGNNTYKAKFTPADTDNYETIENIDITVNVINQRSQITPNIQISDKTYDGTNEIPLENISITNLTTDEYTITSATSSSNGPGNVVATVKIKLSNNKFISHYLEGGLQEKEYTVNFNIIKGTIVASSNSFEGIYDSNEHTISINVNISDYDIKYSTDGTNYNLTTSPKYKEVGEYTIYYKITKEGYNDYYDSNTVKIYGISEYNDSITIKNNMIITSNKSFNNLKDNISLYSTSSSFIHLDKDKQVVETDNIKTGDFVRIVINDTNYEYQIAYLGDVNGDGTIGIIDYIRIMKDIMDTTKLSGIYYEAADMNRNNSIDIIDYIRIMKIIMEED